MKLEIELYGNNKSNNGNAVAIQLGDLTLYFSYKTVIAFKCGDDLYVSQNKWTATTGRHLNAIEEDKSKRIPYEEFELKLKEILKAYNIEV